MFINVCYLRESVASATSDPARLGLHYASNLDFIVPWTQTKFGDRVFSVAGPTVRQQSPGVCQIDEDSYTDSPSLGVVGLGSDFQSSGLAWGRIQSPQWNEDCTSLSVRDTCVWAKCSELLSKVERQAVKATDVEISKFCWCLHFVLTVL